MGLDSVVDHQGDLGLGRIVEYLVMGYPDQRAVSEGAECTPVGVVGCGQAGGERGQVSRSKGEKPQITIPFRQLLMQVKHRGPVGRDQLPDRDHATVGQQCLSCGYRHGCRCSRRRTGYEQVWAICGMSRSATGRRGVAGTGDPKPMRRMACGSSVIPRARRSMARRWGTSIGWDRKDADRPKVVAVSSTC